MKTFWIVVAVVGAQYLIILAVFVGALARAVYRTREISDVIEPEELMDAPQTTAPLDPETLSEVNYECIP